MPISSDGLLERLERNDEWIVAEPFGWPITVNKVHALQYGLFSGFSVGMAASVHPDAAISVTLLLLLLSFGMSPTQLVAFIDSIEYSATIGQRSTLAILTIEHKPHYFWSTYMPSFLLVWAISSLLL